ncbi:MAG: cytochrome c oxidase subunit CcoP [Sediminibacterium sp.]|nr:cytochrome c oxidase subunit CcoP [Sediminibacterium sp.]
MKRITFLRIKQAAILGLLLPLQALAEGAPKKDDLNNPVVQLFVVIIILLAICIGLLAHVLLGAAQLTTKQFLEQKNTAVSGSAKILSLLALFLLSTSAFAADTPVADIVTDNTIGGLSGTTFYGLLSVVLVELIILLGLLYNLKFLLRKETTRIYVEKETVKINWLKYWDKFNSLRPIKEEAQIDLGHDYDGIRELDNRLPPWWLYGFYACIVFAVIYLWRYEVSHTAPSSLDEYNMAMQKGAEEKEAYLLKSASKVDENTVKILSGESDLASGKAIFTSTCAACHSADGGGLVGPNLTDDYWLHGGSVKDIFKTIKYGWQEKGMKSWKDDYTPVQIAQLASYVKTLRGKKPATAKEPQGELFIEDTREAKDSSKNMHEALQPIAVEKKSDGE